LGGRRGGRGSWLLASGCWLLASGDYIRGNPIARRRKKQFVHSWRFYSCIRGDAMNRKKVLFFACFYFVKEFFGAFS
jgi:hypothetical protein